MTTTVANSYRPLGAAASRTAGAATGDGLLGRLTTWFSEQRRYRQTMNELSTLSERELDDIGLTRGDIESVARRCARRA
jgi:uncharacterized protein YjiS (DUF1127 family)